MALWCQSDAFWLSYQHVAKVSLFLMDVLSVTSHSVTLTVNLELIKSAFHSDL